MIFQCKCGTADIDTKDAGIPFYCNVCKARAESIEEKK